VFSFPILLLLHLKGILLMKNINKIFNLLTAFMAVIGVCAAVLVCFIVIYSMPIEQGTSSTGFITDATTQSANVYNSNGNNFDTYSNLEQQQTNDSYVLNTNPERMKIHYPTCNDVAKIAPENYSTSNLSVSELQSQGYSTCGHCFK